MLFVTVGVTLPGIGGILDAKGRGGDPGSLEQEQVCPNQGRDGGRYNRHMQGEEAPQGSWSDQLAATQELHQERTYYRDGIDAVGGHGGGPEGELTPGEQVAGQGDPLNQGKEHEAGQPAQFARALVAPHEQHREHVQEQYQYHHI